MAQNLQKIVCLASFGAIKVLRSVINYIALVFLVLSQAGLATAAPLAQVHDLADGQLYSVPGSGEQCFAIETNKGLKHIFGVVLSDGLSFKPKLLIKLKKLKKNIKQALNSGDQELYLKLKKKKKKKKKKSKTLNQLCEESYPGPTAPDSDPLDEKETNLDSDQQPDQDSEEDDENQTDPPQEDDDEEEEPEEPLYTCGNAICEPGEGPYCSADCGGVKNTYTAETDELIHTGAWAYGTTRVFKEGDIWKFRYEGDETIEYQLNLADTDVQKGVVKIYEVSSDSYPLFNAGPGFRNSTGGMHTPTSLKNFSQLINVSSQGKTVSIDYRDTVDSIQATRRHTFELRGKTLRVRAQSLSPNYHSYYSNYGGFTPGTTNLTEDPKIIKIQGGQATPLASFKNGSDLWFYANHLDLFNSNASDFILLPPDIKPSRIEYGQSTLISYNAASDLKLSAALDETLSIVVTQNIKDTHVISTRKESPWRQLLRSRPVTLLSGDNQWSSYIEMLDLFEDWGMTNLAMYTFNWWNTNTLPQFYPAKDHTGATNFGNKADQLGYPFGLYTYFGPAQPASPYYSASDIAQDYQGYFKQEFGMDALAETAIFKHADREITQAVQNYKASAMFNDVTTYHSPSKLFDGHIDQNSNSDHAKTLRTAIAARKKWLRHQQEVCHGVSLGEGSFSSGPSNMEYLWGGVVDGVERGINSDAGLAAFELPETGYEDLAPTQWPVIPEMELRATILNQSNYGNGHYSRFFSTYDGASVYDLINKKLIVPLTEQALDKYRVYQITYGKTGYFQANGSSNQGGNYLKHADMIKEYYMMSAQHYYTSSSKVSKILYEHQEQLKTFEQIYAATETTQSFKDPRIYIEFENGLKIFINHGSSEWTKTYGQITYRIPEDGFLAYIPGTTFLAFSAKPNTNGYKRIDYVKAPGQYEFLDGRGNAGTFGALTTPYNRIVLNNLATGTVLRERPDTEIEILSQQAPDLIALTVIAPNETALYAGSEYGLQAIGVYSNGALNDLSKLVNWQSSNNSVAFVDKSGALISQGVGSATISVNYQSKVGSIDLIFNNS